MTEGTFSWRRFSQFRLRSLLLLLAIAGVAAAWYSRQRASPRLGLEGYCPVTLVHEEIWTMGLPEHQTVHDGIVYLFAGPEEQRLFEVASARYAPVCSGEDVVRIVDEQCRSLGSRAHGLYFQNRIFLFDSEESLARFCSNPDRYSRFAARNATATAIR